MTSDPQSVQNPKALAKIRSSFPSLAKAERQVAERLFEDPAIVVQVSMAQLAHQCGVSDTTVLRFCRASGFNGYTDLKLSIVRDMADSTQQVLGAVVATDTPEIAARKTFASNIQVLQDTLEMLDFTAFDKAVELFCKASRILITGVGTSGPLVQDMYNKFFRLGSNVWAQTDAYLQIMKVALYGKEDLVVAISQSGGSVDPVQTLKTAREKGASTLCITGNANSPLTEYADVVLLSVSDETRAEAISSRIAQHSLVDALYVAVSLRNIQTATQNEKLIWDAVIKKTI